MLLIPNIYDRPHYFLQNHFYFDVYHLCVGSSTKYYR
jgi:hypothetical protein